MKNLSHYADSFREIQDSLDSKQALYIKCTCARNMSWLVQIITSHWIDVHVKITPRQVADAAYMLFFSFPGHGDGMDPKVFSISQFIVFEKNKVLNCKSGRASDKQNWQSFKQLRHQLVTQAVQESENSIPLAAQRLEIAPSTLYRWLSEDS